MERHGNGKEYVNNNLKFEGEYLYGQRNEKGKEYVDGNIIYEDEYLYGKRIEQENSNLFNCLIF